MEKTAFVINNNRWVLDFIKPPGRTKAIFLLTAFEMIPLFPALMSSPFHQLFVFVLPHLFSSFFNNAAHPVPS